VEFRALRLSCWERLVLECTKSPWIYVYVRNALKPWRSEFRLINLIRFTLSYLLCLVLQPGLGLCRYWYLNCFRWPLYKTLDSEETGIQRWLIVPFSNDWGERHCCRLKKWFEFIRRRFGISALCRVGEPELDRGLKTLDLSAEKKTSRIRPSLRGLATPTL
jgi:hypothetical protein